MEPYAYAYTSWHGYLHNAARLNIPLTSLGSVYSYNYKFACIVSSEPCKNYVNFKLGLSFPASKSWLRGWYWSFKHCAQTVKNQ